MKKLFTAFAALLVFYLPVLNAQDEKHCYTTEIYKERIARHPELLLIQNQLEQETQSQNRVHGGNHTAGQVYIVPVVFHIIHNYGGENISDDQVRDQVRILNDDFRKRSYDTSAIVQAFKSIASDCEIEFRLATKDPDGNCTNGIEHIPSMLTYNADDDSKLNPWPSDQYLNVWTVSTLAWAGAAAYAYYPGTAPPGADGVITLSQYVGSTGTGALYRSRVLTHEIGHYLNLAHVWGSNNNAGVACGDDNVSDTPETEGWLNCNLFGASCGNVIDNVQNYMEYSYCCKMFTEGQGARMRSALNSFVGLRNTLWSNPNLVATGTDGSPDQLCKPVADFKSDRHITCAGNTVQFTDVSWNGKPTSWSWSFPGGTPSTSPDSMPVVQYNTAGTYSVSLTAANASGSSSVTKNSFILVNGTASQIAPYFESFEVAGSFPGTGGAVVNPDGGNTWQRVQNAGSTGSASIRINNYSGNPPGETDEYITPAVDLSGITSPVLDFKVAYAERGTGFADRLKVYVSSDCGQSWTLRYNRAGSSLATVSPLPSSFTPNSSEWRQEHISLLPFLNQPNVRFKFQNISDSGNNLYVDDINILGIISGTGGGIQQETSSGELLIFPNPAAGNFFVNFTVEKTSNVNLKIVDAVGREVKTLVNAEMNAGEYSFDDNLEAGLYFIVLEKDNQKSAKKLIITKE